MKKIVIICLGLLLAIQSFAQFDRTFRKISVDSINARSSRVYVNDTVFVFDTSLTDYINKYSAATAAAAGSQWQIQRNNSGVLGASANLSFNDTTLVVDNGLGTVSIGLNAGSDLSTADNNTLIGKRSGYQLSTGDNNTFIGYEAGRNNISGLTNTFIGNRAGNNATGSGNVFIGSTAGFSETGSNKLYIENSNSANPLIYGEFDNDKLRFNADTSTFVGHVKIDSNLYVNGRSIQEHYEAAAYVDPLLTITTSVTTSYSFLGGGAANQFTNLYSEGFSFDGDTLYFIKDVNDIRDSIEFRVDYSGSTATASNNRTITYAIQIKSVGETIYSVIPQTVKKVRTISSGTYYAGPVLSTIPIFLKDGDKIQIVSKCAATTATVSTQDFGIYLREE